MANNDSKDSANKRKFPRFDADTPARIKVGSDWVNVRLVNVSKGGVCVVAPIPMGLPVVVEIEVFSDPRNPRRFLSRLAWQTDDKAGLEFLTSI